MNVVAVRAERFVVPWLDDDLFGSTCGLDHAIRKNHDFVSRGAGRLWMMLRRDRMSSAPKGTSGHVFVRRRAQRSSAGTSSNLIESSPFLSGQSEQQSSPSSSMYRAVFPQAQFMILRTTLRCATEDHSSDLARIRSTSSAPRTSSAAKFRASVGSHVMKGSAWISTPARLAETSASANELGVCPAVHARTLAEPVFTSPIRTLIFHLHKRLKPPSCDGGFGTHSTSGR